MQWACRLPRSDGPALKLTSEKQLSRVAGDFFASSFAITVAVYSTLCHWHGFCLFDSSNLMVLSTRKQSLQRHAGLPHTHTHARIMSNFVGSGKPEKDWMWYRKQDWTGIQQQKLGTSWARNANRRSSTWTKRTVGGFSSRKLCRTVFAGARMPSHGIKTE